MDVNKKNMEDNLESFRDEVFIEGDATDSDTLLRAGVEKAAGLFAVTRDDNQNLVVSLTAKQLNPRLRIVARCNDTRNTEKMKKAGADAVVSPSGYGRVANGFREENAARPTVVSFLDTMLRDREKEYAG